MRIVFFTDSYRPQINGVVTAIDSLIEQLRKKGHEVHIFCPNSKGLESSSNTHPMPSFKFYPYPEYRVGLPIPSTLNIVKKIKPDIIHVHSPGPIGLMGLTIGRLLRLPIIGHYHTLISEYVQYFAPGTNIDIIKKFGVAAINKYTKWFYSLCNLVLAPSNVMKSFLIDIGVTSPIEVLPVGVKFSKLKKKPVNKVPTILHVGRIVKEKSIDVLVKAFSDVLNHTDARLVITSKGPAETEIKKLVSALGIADKVVFTGYISEREMQNLYRKADVFAFASITETQGLVVLEAMSFGTPVVAAAGGGVLDCVEDRKNGLLFSPGNYQEMSKKIQQILANKILRKKLVSEGLKTVKLMSIEETSRHLENIYKSIYEEKISIVIPTYMEEKYIADTLKGLETQTYKNFEIIVADSDSKDKTRKIAEEYADKVINVKRRGIGLGRNVGAKASKGSIILFLDADTVLNNDFLENILRAFRNKNVVMVGGSIRSSGSLSARFIFWGTAQLAWILSKIGTPKIYGMCIAVRKEIFDKLGGFDEKLHTAEDIDFTERAAKLGKCVVARDAIAYTSPRRLKMRGAFFTVIYHIVNFFRYKLFGRGSEDYPAIR